MSEPIKVYGYNSMFSTSFKKGNNFCELLFALYEIHKKLPLGSKFFPLMTSIEKEGKHKNGRAASPEMVSIYP